MGNLEEAALLVQGVNCDLQIGVLMQAYVLGDSADAQAAHSLATFPIWGPVQASRARTVVKHLSLQSSHGWNERIEHSG